MRKYNISRNKITDSKGNAIMRKSTRIMAPSRVELIASTLVELLNETLAEDSEDEVS